ncbi:MAG: hypothetical protein ABUL46_02355 [Chitinophaga rupis]
MSIGLAVENIPQQFTVDTANITGQGGPESPQLLIPIAFSLTPRQQSNLHPPTQFDVIRIDAELFLTSKGIKVSNQSKPVYIPVWQSTQFSISLSFAITKDTIYYVQKHRDSNVSGSLRLTLQVAHHPDPPKIDPNKIPPPTFIRQIDTTGGHHDFVIEQSRWINNVLPGLGHESASLIEIPHISAILPAEYSIALPELADARQYFQAGDYHKTIVHCRIALDRIHDQFPREKGRLPTDGRFQRLQANLNANHIFAKTIIDANYSMATKAHHASGVIFGRAEAETILHMTTAIIAYIGKILPESTPEPS